MCQRDGEKLYKEYWEAVPSLAAVKSRLEKEWEATSKKALITLDGRVLTVRSKHSLMNMLFQSSGSLVTKYACCRTAQMLEERGLWGDVTKDGYEDYPKKVYQLIVYHEHRGFKWKHLSNNFLNCWEPKAYVPR